MRRLMLPVAGLCGLAVAVVPALAANQDVRTSGTSFVPSQVAVKPGEKVTIRNLGRGFHNVHWEDRALAEFPPSTDEWQTERTFTAPGEYRFYCDPHRDSGMRATVYVNDAGTVPGSGGGTTTSTTTTPTGTTTSPEPPPGGTTTTSTTPPPPPDTAAPRASAVRAFATRRGVRLRMTLSEPAKVTVRVLRRGRRVARRTFSVTRGGAVTVRVRRALRPGRYRVRLTLVDAAGNRS
ncbi:MAG TPA: plastocyanin/azurin family copper-binding protein, partial [Solirubrobacteraceae bacterium]|nr:plastocyanin/azurin family copper-binding protein [Solirubrobacteraceae bacterium]